MDIRQQEAPFLSMVRDQYGGQAKVDIIFDASNEKVRRLPEGHRATSIRLLLGKPEVIGAERVYPVELPAFGIYNPDRDGNLSEDAATGFMLRSALNRTYPGAPSQENSPFQWYSFRGAGHTTQKFKPLNVGNQQLYQNKR